MRSEQIIIVGFGPAGIACAIQLKRMGLEPLVIEKSRPGGMLFNAGLVENYPGFPAGIPGTELAALMTEHARRFLPDPVRDEIRQVDYSGDEFHLSGLEDIYTCRRLVVATGTFAVFPKLYPGELIRKGLIHSNIIRLRDVTGMIIGIIGAGDAAFDYALSLVRNGNRVMIFNRGTRVKALKVLQEAVFQQGKITYCPKHELVTINESPDGRLEADFMQESVMKKVILDNVIFATGRAPALSILDPEIIGRAKTLNAEGRLFIIGDAANGQFRQVSAAVGDGVRIAMEIFHHERNKQDPG